MGKLYVHCGLHKTGTTALQRFLAEHRDGLRQAGLCYPHAGTVGSGHHNLAWELTRDRRYAAQRGGLAAVEAEIAGAAGDLVLSSEDFESLLGRPQAWEPLLRLAERTGRRLVVVVYVQNQAAYLDSLYLQCLKAGIAEEFTAFAEEVIARGAVQRREWTFQFDYVRALEPLGGLDCELVVRNYHQLEGGSTIADFLLLVGAPLETFGEAALGRRAHTRLTLPQALFRFYRRRVEREPTEAEKRTIIAMASKRPEPQASAALGAQVMDAFQASNQALRRRFGLPETGLLGPLPPRPAMTDLARVFSFETQLAIAQIAAGAAVLADSRALRVDPAGKALFAQWADWVTKPDAPAPGISPLGTAPSA